MYYLVKKSRCRTAWIIHINISVKSRVEERRIYLYMYLLVFMCVISGKVEEIVCCLQKKTR